MPLKNETVNKTNSKRTFRFQIALTFIATLLLTICSDLINAQTVKADSLDFQEKRRSFTFTAITEVEFRNGLKNNFNAPFKTEVIDSTNLERAFESIEETYNESEKELAERELCESPKCLTSFKAYYPSLDLYLFYISDHHYSKASFVYASSCKMASGYKRFRGDFGVMSKNGLWVGLERDDCDNYLQIEICKYSKNGMWSVFTFDFRYIDINEKEETAMFWADKNTIYLATHEYDQESKKAEKYYAIKFEI
jgi:hypothetical protein